MVKTVDASTFRQRFGTLLDEVYYRKESIIIERKGKAMARLIPVDAASRADSTDRLTPEQSRLLAELGSMPTVSMNQDPTAVLRRLRAKKAKLSKDHDGT